MRLGGGGRARAGARRRGRSSSSAASPPRSATCTATWCSSATLQQPPRASRCRPLARATSRLVIVDHLPHLASSRRHARSGGRMGRAEPLQRSRHGHRGSAGQPTRIRQSASSLRPHHCDHLGRPVDHPQHRHRLAPAKTLPQASPSASRRPHPRHVRPRPRPLPPHLVLPLPLLELTSPRCVYRVPIYSIASLISLYSLELAFFLDAIRDVYEVRLSCSSPLLSPPQGLPGSQAS